MTARVRLFACGVVLTLAAAGARAQAQLVVLRVDPAAEAPCEQLEKILIPWGVTPDPGYRQEAQRRRLQPSSEAALLQLIPALQVQLALVPVSADAGAMYVDIRDGATGSGLGSIALPLENGALRDEGRRALEAELVQRIGPAPGRSDETTSTPAASEAESEPDGALSLQFRVFGGFGVGARDLRWSQAGETLEVETGAFPALEVGTSFFVSLGRTLALGPELAYQTSFQHQIEETHIAGQPDSLRVRVHRFDAVLAAPISIGSAGFRIVPAIGYGVRAMRPEVHHLLTPSYSLAGPLFRLGFRIPILGGLALRIAPEAQWIVVGDELEERGISAHGLAIGGEVAIEVALSSALSLELTARDARARLPAPQAAAASDIGQFATARLVWQP